MKVLLGADKAGLALKNVIKQHILSLGYEVVDQTGEEPTDLVDSTLAVTSALKAGTGELGILFDGYGAGSFMAANKVKGMIAAEVSDERSARMTRDHNNTQIITIGSEIVGEALAKACTEAFLVSKYSGGRHQVRVDMLNRML
ncbi:galactose-6-phosphate isomerase subunit LacA [Carnobacterium maltaromaticum]|uniref:galactose-6-phosphate isomerase subunit LacA n=1 Tax=Carnobacterium maltaromaticum TaxID=2751 RepID=UPI00191B9F1A|nr:galactose-6-phosphate isomerase subunit LacA [Carnobacterium maltaromaticum]CAD5901642.1 Galactose-6-phosphate isomerase subunit LacA [Carnobacterium maltaromaticum]